MHIFAELCLFVIYIKLYLIWLIICSLLSMLVTFAIYLEHGAAGLTTWCQSYFVRNLKLHHNVFATTVSCQIENQYTMSYLKDNQRSLCSVHCTTLSSLAVEVQMGPKSLTGFSIVHIKEKICCPDTLDSVEYLFLPCLGQFHWSFISDTDFALAFFF